MTVPRFTSAWCRERSTHTGDKTLIAVVTAASRVDRHCPEVCGVSDSAAGRFTRGDKRLSPEPQLTTASDGGGPPRNQAPVAGLFQLRQHGHPRAPAALDAASLAISFTRRRSILPGASEQDHARLSKRAELRPLYDELDNSVGWWPAKRPRLARTSCTTALMAGGHPFPIRWGQ